MTGEIVVGAAAAKAAGKAARAIGAENKAVNQELLRQSEDTPGMTRAAELYGQRQAIKQQIIVNAWKPLAKIFGVSANYFEQQFAEDLSEKLVDVPEEDIQSPKASVAGPAAQALGYSLDEPELKNLYLELLANASNKLRADDAHPAFADVIRQLTSEEAVQLKDVLQAQVSHAIAKVKSEKGGTEGYTVVSKNLIDFGMPLNDPSNLSRVASYVDNWVRLGLVTVDYTSHLTRADAYEWVEDHPSYVIFKNALEHLNGQEDDAGKHTTLSFDRGIMVPTAFGLQFAAIVGMTGQ